MAVTHVFNVRTSIETIGMSHDAKVALQMAEVGPQHMSEVISTTCRSDAQKHTAYIHALKTLENTRVHG